MAVPDGYTTFEWYFMIAASYAVLLFVKAFLLYLFYGFPMTLVYIVFRVFWKRNEPIRSLDLG
ncbi:MAG: hypothetical protein IT172_10585 [Acidobacteria bacterium]|nr:hypothetical protein [Acidobacteriota bacterium]